jgi:hypothetical protein
MHRTMLQSALHGTTRRGKPLHRSGNVYPPARTFQAISILQSEFRKFPLVITSSLRGECKTLQQYGQNLPLGDLLVSPPSGRGKPGRGRDPIYYKAADPLGQEIEDSCNTTIISTPTVTKCGGTKPLEWRSSQKEPDGATAVSLRSQCRASHAPKAGFWRALI